jgi:hypothetical protein
MYLHQMFPFERLMSIFRKYVRNMPEGFIVEGWTTEEAIEFRTYYLDINRVGVLESCHKGRLRGKGTMGEKSIIVDDNVGFRQAHFAVFQQAQDVKPYNDEHRRSLQTQYTRRSPSWLAKKHKETFGAWLRHCLMGRVTGSPRLHILTLRPSSTLVKYQGYDINGFTFDIVQQDGKKRNQNIGVHFDAHDENNNVETTYYGFKEEIWELDYGALKVPLFFAVSGSMLIKP